ncbi:hypothetical protein T484DRAFT_1819034 [Baffinella frigidus]|nr:hypothetical protein T484DRAFT_1819034 [Cryptophyta sp. CCMP2293]
MKKEESVSKPAVDLFVSLVLDRLAALAGDRWTLGACDMSQTMSHARKLGVLPRPAARDVIRGRVIRLAPTLTKHDATFFAKILHLWGAPPAPELGERLAALEWNAERGGVGRGAGGAVVGGGGGAPKKEQKGAAVVPVQGGEAAGKALAEAASVRTMLDLGQFVGAVLERAGALALAGQGFVGAELERAGALALAGKFNVRNMHGSMRPALTFGVLLTPNLALVAERAASVAGDSDRNMPFLTTIIMPFIS